MDLNEPVFWILTGRDLVVAVMTGVLFKVLGFFASGCLEKIAADPLGVLLKLVFVIGVGLFLGSTDKGVPQEHKDLYMVAGLIFMVIGGYLARIRDRQEPPPDGGNEDKHKENAKPGVKRRQARDEAIPSNTAERDADISK